MHIDFARPKRHPLVGDMLRRAREAGIKAPMLEVAFAHLQAFEVRSKRAS